MTEQCPLCGKEKIDGQAYCVTSGCGWHFGSNLLIDPQREPYVEVDKLTSTEPEHSYIKSEEKWENDKKEMEKEQKQPEPQSNPSFVRSEDEWEKERKEMEEEAESSDPTFTAKIIDDIERQGILVLPGGKEIPFEDNPKTVGRSDVREFVEMKVRKDPNEVSSQQFTIYRLPSQSTMINAGYDYFIEDRVTSVQNKPSTNHTKVNGEDITGQLKKELHDGDKIEFAHIEECVAMFKTR